MVGVAVSVAVHKQAIFRRNSRPISAAISNTFLESATAKLVPTKRSADSYQGRYMTPPNLTTAQNYAPTLNLPTVLSPPQRPKSPGRPIQEVADILTCNIKPFQQNMLEMANRRIAALDLIKSIWPVGCPTQYPQCIPGLLDIIFGWCILSHVPGRRAEDGVALP